MSVLEWRDVGVQYKRAKVPALQGVTDTVRAGEWLGLVGPNGAGKSSLLKAVVGLVAHSGRVLVDDTSLSDMSDRERAACVAYVAQEPLIPDDMTAFDYALLGRTPYISYFGAASRRDRTIVGDVLEQLRLTEFADRLMGELSGGERQRIVLARALSQQASILLLDEPTSALDIGHQQQALELITELRRTQQLTVVSALHDLTLAGTYTDRLMMLHHGEVVTSGTAADVLTAERLGAVFNVCVTVEHDEGQVIVVPRRGFAV